MGISIGGINLAEAIVNLEYELGRTQRILDWIVVNNKLRMPDQESMKKMEEEVIAAVRKKYPEAGVQRKSQP